MGFCRVPAAGARGIRSSCQCWWSGFGHRFLSCSSCWSTRSSIHLPVLIMRIWAWVPVVLQLLEHVEPDSAACWWYIVGHDSLSRSSCWNTGSSIQPPMLVVRIWAWVCVLFQLLEHREFDPAANACGQDFDKDFRRGPAAGTRGARFSCDC